MRNVGLCILWVLALGVVAQADCPSPCTSGRTCYYVDNVAGNDANSGTDPSTPWKHAFKVRSQTFVSAPIICWKRGDTWYGRQAYQGTRAVTASGAVTPDGTASAPVLIDAYGSGAPPLFNAEFPVPSSTSWTCAANICTINTNTVFPEGAPSRIDMVKFGAVWGVCKGMSVAIYCPSTGGTAALTANRQFNYDTGTGVLAVYDNLGSNPVTDYGGVAAVIDGATNIIDLDGVNYVNVQHLRILNQSWYGIEYRGGAGTDHLVLANLYSDTEVPFNLHGTGFLLHPASGAADLQLYNLEAHRGFNGFSFECPPAPAVCSAANSISAAVLKNAKGYFNRNFGLNDSTFAGAAVSYSNVHFYGNQIKWSLVGDVNGGVAGPNVISNLADPAVKSWQLYTPRMALTFGDVGRQNGADTAFNNYVAALGAAPVSIGVATNFPVVPSLVATIQGWVNAGYDINLLGLSDVSYQNFNTLFVRYTGAGSAASLTISGNHFIITVTGAADSLNYDLTNASFDTVQEVEFALRATGKYTATLPQPCSACSWISSSAMLSKDFQTVMAQDIRTAAYTVQFNAINFLNDELSGAKTWLTNNLTGSSGKFIYWYPGLLFCNDAPCAPLASSPEAYTQSNGYDAARGSISMQAGADGIVGGYDLVAAKGVDAHGLVTCQMGGWNNLSPGDLKKTIQAIAEKSAVWGVPYVCYFQPGTISSAQLANAVADLAASGVTLMTTSALASLLQAKTNLPASSTSYAWGPDGTATSYDGSETYISPTVGTGADLGSVYQLDVWGRQQAQFRAGWDMGAGVLVPTYLGKHPGR